MTKELCKGKVVIKGLTGTGVISISFIPDKYPDLELDLCDGKNYLVSGGTTLGLKGVSVELEHNE